MGCSTIYTEEEKEKEEEEEEKEDKSSWRCA
jgi:hypothetical protein